VNIPVQEDDRQSPDRDDFSDLAEIERPLPDPFDLSEALPAKLCGCPVPRRNEDTCHRCGRSLPPEAGEAYEAA
jgi:hypothetical protein